MSKAALNTSEISSGKAGYVTALLMCQKKIQRALFDVNILLSKKQNAHKQGDLKQNVVISSAFSSYSSVYKILMK